MIRDVIRSSVENINPLDDLEKAHRQDVIDWIDSGADLFRLKKPDVPPKHLVSYFVLADRARKKMLLVHHKKANLWLPPGGHVEPNEHPRDATSRECMEELGVEAIFTRPDPQLITVTSTVNTSNPHTDVSLWYLLLGKEEQELEWDRGEFNSIRWWPIDEIQATPISEFDPHMHRFIRKLGKE